MVSREEAKAKAKEKAKAEKLAIEAELEERTSDKLILSYAKQFYDGYLIITNAYPKETEQHAVKYFLLCRTFELLCKAFMRSKGATRKELKDEYGHDLVKLIIGLKRYEVLLGEDTVELIKRINLYYSEKFFEYPITGYKSLPPLEEIRRSVHLFMAFVNSKVWGVPPFTDAPIYTE